MIQYRRSMPTPTDRRVTATWLLTDHMTSRGKKTIVGPTHVRLISIASYSISLASKHCRASISACVEGGGLASFEVLFGSCWLQGMAERQASLPPWSCQGRATEGGIAPTCGRCYPALGESLAAPARGGLCLGRSCAAASDHRFFVVAPTASVWAAAPSPAGRGDLGSGGWDPPGDSPSSSTTCATFIFFQFFLHIVLNV